MCRPDGMVFDDGVVMRVGEDRFLCTTTTGNAARGARLDGGVAADRVAASCGSGSRRSPSSGRRSRSSGPTRASCSPRLTAIPLDAESFPFMAIARGRGRRASRRGSCRVSFSGELAFEVNVDGRRGLALWEAIYARGRARRRTAPRRCTCCAPRRATRSSARTPTARSRRRTSAWTGSCRRRSPTSSASARSRAPTRARPDRKQLVGLLPRRPGRAAPRGRAARRRRRATRGDARPRHVELPQRRARPDVRARAAAAAAATGSARPSTRRSHRRRSRPRSPTPVLYDTEGARRDGRPD